MKKKAKFWVGQIIVWEGVFAEIESIETSDKEPFYFFDVLNIDLPHSLEAPESEIRPLTAEEQGPRKGEKK